MGKQVRKKASNGVRKRGPTIPLRIDSLLLAEVDAIVAARRSLIHGGTFTRNSVLTDVIREWVASERKAET